MKKLNFLSKVCGLARASQYCDVSVDRRLTVGSPSGLHQLTMYIAVMFLLLVVGAGNVWADIDLRGKSSALTIPLANSESSYAKGDWRTIGAPSSSGSATCTITQSAITYGTISLTNVADTKADESGGYPLQFTKATGSVSFVIKSDYGVDVVVRCKSKYANEMTIDLTDASQQKAGTAWGTKTISTTNTSATLTLASKSGAGGACGITYIKIVPKTSGGGGLTTYTVTYNANSGSGTVTDGSSPYADNSSVKTLPNAFTRSGYIFTNWNTQADGNGTNYAEGASFSITANTTLYAKWVASSTRDDLSRATTGISNGAGYGSWSDKSASNSGHSSAVYAGTSAGGNDAIQLRSSGSVEGIVTTTSGGKAKYVYVVWEGHTTAGRTINIYGKNEAYSSAADLFSATAATQGELLGSIVCGTSTVLAISGDYKYIGIRSKADALYLSSVSIEWATATLSSIAITTQPTTRKYLAGETFSKTGAVVTATYSDASTKDVSASATWSPTTALTAGTGKTVTASYTESGVTKTATTTIDVYSVSFTKQDEDGTAISAEGVTASASGKSITAAVGSTNYFFKQWQFKTASGMNVSSATNAGTTLTGTPTGNVELIAVYYKPRVIEWKVNNVAYTPGSPGSATMKYNSEWSELTLPTDPDVSNYCGQKFVGWTTTDLEENALDKDDDADAIDDLNLMTSANKSDKTTVITNDTTTFHAVFADYDE